MSENEGTLLRGCQALADELGELLNPSARLVVSVQAEPSTRRAKQEPPRFLASARISSAPASHQRPVQADSEGTSAVEALAYLKAALELKTRFMRSGRSGTRKLPG